MAEVGCDCCRIYWRGVPAPAVCPHCGGPVPTPPPPRHEATTLSWFPGEGHVLWCSCGMGTPAKPTVEAAKRSLAPHLADPRVFPV